MTGSDKHILSLETAILLGIRACETGDTATAREVCRQVLEVEPGNPSALLLDLWASRRAGGAAETQVAASRLLQAEDIWAQVPRFPDPAKAPLCLDPAMRRFFADELPAAGDISDHLPTLFHEVLSLKPRLIVELGTRGGQSTRTFLAATTYTRSRMLSVDIENLVLAGLPADASERWSFVHSDDIAFGEQGFQPWCAGQGLAPEIDLLFIDTSHEYEHTKEELRVWMPWLAPRGVVLLHDTNLDDLFERQDGSLGTGWNNQRGVIRAIEEFVGQPLDEKRPFVTIANGWLIRHAPNCNGLTSLRRVG